MNRTNLVFVYGTLKQGHGNHRLLEEAEQVGRTMLSGGYSMFDLGWYPGVALTKDVDRQTPVYGEVYRVTEDEMRGLDILEGHPDFYNRIVVDTEFGQAWLYVLPQDYLDNPVLVQDGHWEPEPAEVTYWQEKESA